MINLALTPQNFDGPSDERPASFFNRGREQIHQQMLSSVSHDLKTPLASIIGSLEVYARMRDKLSVEKQNTLIDVALQEAYRLDTFITNILDMAKLENGLVTPRPEDVEIGTMLRHCLTRMDHRFKGNVVDMQAMSGAIKTTTDAALLSRVVCLVLDNAVKHSREAPGIRVAFGKDDKQAGYISVQDNGPGIPEERRDIIFHKYTRFANEDQQNAGTGLGLAIAREIMHLLKGEITTHSHADGGAVFVLRFPLESRL